jgi:hypothetical protein
MSETTEQTTAEETITIPVALAWMCVNALSGYQIYANGEARAFKRRRMGAHADGCLERARLIGEAYETLTDMLLEKSRHKAEEETPHAPE